MAHIRCLEKEEIEKDIYINEVLTQITDKPTGTTFPVLIGSDIYLCRINYNPRTIYKFNISTESYNNISTVMPYDAFGVVAYNNYIYCFCKSAQIYKIDPVNDTGSYLSKIVPGIGGNLSCCLCGSKVYIFSDSTGNDVYYYDIINNTIVYTSIEMPISYIKAEAAAGNDIYCFSTQSDKPIYKFDTISNSFTSLGTMTYGGNTPTATTLGKYIYVPYWKNPVLSRYNIEENTMTIKSSLSINSSYTYNACSTKKFVYLFSSNTIAYKIQVKE